MDIVYDILDTTWSNKYVNVSEAFMDNGRYSIKFRINCFYIVSGSASGLFQDGSKILRFY